MSREAGWRALEQAAYAYAAAAKPATAEAAALSEAGKQWGYLNPAPRDVAANSGAVIPFGRAKGTLVVDAEVKDLHWVAGALRNSIADEAKAQWRTSNEQLLHAIEDELERR